MAYLPTLFTIFLYLFAPILVWLLVWQLLRWRGLSSVASQAFGLLAAALMLTLALVYIANTTQRLSDPDAPPAELAPQPAPASAAR